MVEKQKILVSGVSGLIGRALMPVLTAKEYEVTRLVRKETGARNEILWNPMQPLAAKMVSGFDCVVHLAGETLSGLWTKTKTRRIRESRVIGTQHLADALAAASQPPRVFICASASGYYGSRGEELLTENSAMGKGFLAETCREWEDAAESAKNAGIRTLHLRISLVLSAQGGALKPLLLPSRLGLASAGSMGSGRQWWSWIHIDDLAQAVHHCLQNESFSGPINVTSLHPVTNAEFTKTLAAVLRRPTFATVPEFMLHLLPGKMGEEIFLSSQRVEPAKLKASGFRFQYPELRGALNQLLEK
jgi:uncharacterized protein (TIGR01777 family)